MQVKAMTTLMMDQVEMELLFLLQLLTRHFQIQGGKEAEEDLKRLLQLQVKIMTTLMDQVEMEHLILI